MSIKKVTLVITRLSRWCDDCQTVCPSLDVANVSRQFDAARLLAGLRTSGSQRVGLHRDLTNQVGRIESLASVRSVQFHRRIRRRAEGRRCHPDAGVHQSDSVWTGSRGHLCRDMSLTASKEAKANFKCTYRVLIALCESPPSCNRYSFAFIHIASRSFLILHLSHYVMAANSQFAFQLSTC